MPTQPRNPSRRRRPIAIAGAVMVAVLTPLAAAACGGSSSDGSASSSTSLTPTTTTAVPPTTNAAPPPIPTTPITITSPADGVSPRGSGCSPSEDTLPDGTWFGELKSVDTAASTISLDLECMYVGPAADAKAASMGDPTPVPNDYLITNDSTKLFVIPVWPDVQVLPLEMVAPGGFTGANEPASTGLANATTILTMAAPKLVWVQITNGRAIVIQSQFTP